MPRAVALAAVLGGLRSVPVAGAGPSVGVLGELCELRAVEVPERVGGPSHTMRRPQQGLRERRPHGGNPQGCAQ
eukprot:615594-Lingulodinium_polyedra.AAC.1